ncbi:MAG: T9SS C-terminal target domain-containing protein [Calditrichaeota bacterium]|nr:MAG: T9SS C-terminal target domain-containing protein [Calditrichota bacterium]
MKRFSIIVMLLSFFTIGYSQHGWVRQTGVFWSFSEDLYFMDEDTGFVGCSSGLYRTTDGGQTWQLIPNIIYPANKIAFAGNQVGYVLSDKHLIFKTTDGGATWQQTYDFGVFELIWMISTADGNNVYAIAGSSGSDGVVYHSTDGGMTFDSTASFPCDTCGWYMRVYALGSNTVIISGADRYVFKSIDGGNTWYSIFEADEAGWNIMLYPQNDGRIFLSIENGELWVSANQGESWNYVYFATSTGVAHLRSLNFLGARGYAVRKALFPGNIRRYFARTFDNGHSWRYSFLPEPDIEIIYFINQNVGWAIGDNSELYKTTTGAATNSFIFFQSKNTLNKPINDFQTTSDTISVNLSGTALFGPPHIVDMRVTIDTVLHPQSSELELKLIHAGVTDTLAFDLTSPGANFIHTVFDDSATMSITSGNPPYTGAFQPYRPLAQFNGMDLNGDWILEVYDHAAGNTGTLNAWGLEIEYEDNLLAVDRDSPGAPESFALYQNYPNPFNPGTIIRYTVGNLFNGKTGRQRVSLKVYDILGNEVATLVNGIQNPGTYEVEFNASGLSSGIYFYTLKSGDFMATKKMIFLK